MALTHSVTCDICRTPKREANHWFTYLEDAGRVTFYPWSEHDYLQHNHVCSERCCMTVLSRTLAKWGQRAIAA